MNDRIPITGAAGQLARLVIDQLLEVHGLDGSRLIATTRDPARLDDLAAKGVTVRKADFDDTGTLDAAFKGAEKILIVSTDALGEPGKRLRQHQNAIAAAAAAGVSHIAYTSMPNPEPGNAVLFAPDHYGSEQAIRKTGLAYTIFRNGWYQENLLHTFPNIVATGKWFSAAGTGRLAHVARADVAAAIAGALVADASDSATYTLTGPQARSADEIAALASEILGKPIEVVHLSDEALLEGLLAAGVPDGFAPTLVSFDTNTRNGAISDVTGDVEKLSGRPPRSLERFFEDNRSALTG